MFLPDGRYFALVHDAIFLHFCIFAFSNFSFKTILIFLSLAAPAALAGTTAAATALTPHIAHQDVECYAKDEKKEKQALEVHERRRLKRNDTTQATAHWKNTTSSAQRPPSSRRTVAMAATQGV